MEGMGGMGAIAFAFDCHVTITHEACVCQYVHKQIQCIFFHAFSHYFTLPSISRTLLCVGA